jgi:hypothetical protein
MKIIRSSAWFATFGSFISSRCHQILVTLSAANEQEPRLTAPRVAGLIGKKERAGRRAKVLPEFKRAGKANNP